MSAKALDSNLRLYVRFIECLLILALLLLLPSAAWASPPAVNSTVGFYVCKLADNFQGNAGRGIATIGISTLGVLALVGRVTWVQALVVGVGCATLFGAPILIVQLGATGVCP